MSEPSGRAFVVLLVLALLAITRAKTSGFICVQQENTVGCLYEGKLPLIHISC